MGRSGDTTISRCAHAREFATTRWSVIERARGPGTEDSFDALEKLCRAYWYPLYAFARRTGKSPQDSEDLVQGFFASLLSRQDLGKVSAAKGKFRSFLLAALKHYISKQRDWDRALKRGGGHPQLSLDVAEAEALYAVQSPSAPAPDVLFERSWVRTLLERALERLRGEHESAGKLALFESLKPALTGDRSSLPHAELAKTLGMSEANVKVTIHRLRRRYRDLLREEIAETVSGPGEVENELRDLFRILA